MRLPTYFPTEETVSSGLELLLSKAKDYRNNSNFLRGIIDFHKKNGFLTRKQISATRDVIDSIESTGGNQALYLNSQIKWMQSYSQSISEIEISISISEEKISKKIEIKEKLLAKKFEHLLKNSIEDSVPSLYQIIETQNKRLFLMTKFARKRQEKIRRKEEKRVRVTLHVAPDTPESRSDAKILFERFKAKDYVNAFKADDYNPPCPTCGMPGCPMWGLP